MHLMNVNEKIPVQHDQMIDLLISFVESVGIEVKEGITGDHTFVPGLEIQNGVLVFERKKLSYPGDILHEAGHIAVTIAANRKRLHGNVTDNDLSKGGDEFAVMLWSYAACKKLKIDPAIVFHKNGYKGDSQWLIDNYDKGTYIGLPLLVWMGMTGKDGFPVMLKWLRD